MKSKNTLILLFSVILVGMLCVTTWASAIINVWDGGGFLLHEPWGIATLADTYCGFFTFYFWLFYKENGWISRGVWLVAIILLGNIAMSSYVLWQIFKLGSSFTIENLLLKNSAAVKAGDF